jgi:ATP-binding cassette subfamily B protein AbcA/BmrA
MIDRLVDVDNKYYEDHKKGEIIFNVMNNNSSLENIFSTALFTMGSDIFGLLWIIIILLNTNATLLLILLAFFPFIYYLSLMTGKAQRELSQKRINIENDMTAFVDQTITGIDIIKSYFGKNREINTYTKFANDIFGFSKHADRKLSVYFVIETAIKTTALVCALYFCVKMIEKGQLTTGIIPMVIIYSEKLFSPVSNFTKYYQIIQRGLVSLNQISDLLRFPLSKKEFISQTALTISPNNSLSIKSLCVNRKEKNIFEDFNLNISSNGLYLIRGESGSGKSTLIKAILGFLEPLRGTIAINGVTHYSYNYLSYAGQDPFLTDATILDNTLYPYDSQSSDRDLISNAQLLIKNTRLNRIDAQKMIGEFGGKISSGEKQRICFLRALLKSTPVLLLDEITSNVDYETEMLMINMLKIEKRKRIVLLATHSMNQELLNAADMIIQL